MLLRTGVERDRRLHQLRSAIQMSATGLKRLLFRAAEYAMIVVVTLVVVDLLLIALGLFPPEHDYGDPEVGWRAAPATDSMVRDWCIEHASGEVFTFDRNQDGVRSAVSASALRADMVSLKIGVTGDSHTELCAANEDTHFGVLESTLRAHGQPALSFAFGAGAYSPLQAYLAFDKVLRRYDPDVFVLNLYTGNDFYDMLRVDDRPHFKGSGTGYEIADPVWYKYDRPGTIRRSRVLFVMNELTQRTGLQRLSVRVRILGDLARDYGVSPGTVLAYMRDLVRATESSVGYPHAFTAQMLNQQLFFHHFPGAREESIRRISALMAMVRRENPGVLLVMSPLPSYELVQGPAVGEALERTLARLPITLESGVHEEQQLYDLLRELAAEHGWLFVDPLPALRAYGGSESLFNDFDYHLLPPGSAIVGQVQAAAILQRLLGAPGRELSAGDDGSRDAAGVSRDRSRGPA